MWQVEKAFEHLVQFSSCIERDVRFSIQCGVNYTKGIHLRSGTQEKPKEYPVYIEPVFHEDSGNFKFFVFQNEKDDLIN